VGRCPPPPPALNYSHRAARSRLGARSIPNQKNREVRTGAPAHLLVRTPTVVQSVRPASQPASRPLSFRAAAPVQQAMGESDTGIVYVYSVRAVHPRAFVLSFPFLGEMRGQRTYVTARLGTAVEYGARFPFLER
jgi:hypothetical protein